MKGFNARMDKSSVTVAQQETAFHGPQYVYLLRRSALNSSPTIIK